ncbi:hypothetical protein M2397_005904 [Pseudomonas sp. BIGb0381]|nr:hypothetical protein [Pseudomonas sp. BIGb0381]MCS4315570.1 hypothetical protein [Pseudomonas sp. BIGb0381]
MRLFCFEKLGRYARWVGNAVLKVIQLGHAFTWVLDWFDDSGRF